MAPRMPPTPKRPDLDALVKKSARLVARMKPHERLSMQAMQSINMMIGFAMNKIRDPRCTYDSKDIDIAKKQIKQYLEALDGVYYDGMHFTLAGAFALLIPTDRARARMTITDTLEKLEQITAPS
jgi:hypothetical protein